MKWETLACKENIIYTVALLSTPLNIEETHHTLKFKSTDGMREVWYFDNFYSIFNYNIWANIDKEVCLFLSRDFSNKIVRVRLV